MTNFKSQKAVQRYNERMEKIFRDADELLKHEKGTKCPICGKIIEDPVGHNMFGCRR